MSTVALCGRASCPACRDGAQRSCRTCSIARAFFFLDSAHYGSSVDQVDRARPGLMAVGLGHAHVDRQIGAAREGDAVVEGQSPAPVAFGQTIDAELAAETAAVERNCSFGELPEVDLSRHDVAVDAQRA